MNESILNTVKDGLVPEGVTAFDGQLIVLINAIFMGLHQLGIGPSEGYRISSSANTWSEYTNDEIRMEAVKAYVMLKARLLFDNTTISSGTISIIQEELKELEFRLSVMFDPEEGNVL